MKRVKTFLTNAIVIIIVLPVLIIAAVYLILLIPFDYIRYKKSFYYKNEKQKYTLFAGTNENFKVYNAIEKYNLPIQYIKHPQDDSIESGWFAYGETLFIINFLDFEYDEQREIWTGWQEEDGEKVDLMQLDELIGIELEEKNALVDGNPYKDAVVWISAEALSDFEQAKKERRFLIYEKNREEALRRFCEL